MKIDSAKVPWSRRGARLALALDAEGPVLKDVGGGDEVPSGLFDLRLLVGGTEVSCVADASPAACTLIAAEGGAQSVHLQFSGVHALELVCRGAGLRLAMRKARYDHITEVDEGCFEIQSYVKDRKYLVDLRQASWRLDAPWAAVGNERIVLDIEAGRARIEEYVIKPLRAENVAEPESAEDFARWCEGLPAVGKRFASLCELAAYITWSCMVAPEGRLTRQGMYMSKNWMTNVWSWDNCFNGLGLARRFPRLALEQLALMMDNQDATGAYPDYVNDKFASFSCLKPPIHAWALRGILARADEGLRPEDRALVSPLVASIALATKFWLGAMRLPSGALVYKHGNDSGWDNASIFACGGPVESPDLYAHLARQCDILGDFAAMRGRDEEAAAWRAEAERLVATMLERLYDEEGFFARRGRSGERVEDRGSLILRLPLIVARRLPPSVIEAVVDDLGDEEQFLAPFGLATEARNSPQFRRNGYWLGPVWAPTTYLFIDALREAGYTSLAGDVAARFLAAAERGGCAENFDPETGEGLVDPAFTWTASVVLLLFEEYPEIALR